MDTKYIANAKILKAISDPKRLCIIDMLSGGELCACDLLERFHITQPTLSHDMKVLCDAGIVQYRRDGKWTYYSLQKENVKRFSHFLNETLTEKINSSAPIAK